MLILICYFNHLAYMRKYLLHVLIIPFVFLSMSFAHAEEEACIGLRSSYSKLSVSQVQSMSHVSMRKKEDWGFFGHSTINHEYDLKIINVGNNGKATYRRVFLMSIK